MRWKIENYIFCDQRQTLTRDSEVQQLEPILVELLAYFCQHPDTIIGRDELIEHVWRGRTITDSAVNRAITKLRRCLGDNPKAPKFIATFPKKGYKFIAPLHDMTQVEQPKSAPVSYSAPIIPTPRLVQKNTLLLSIVVFAIVVAVVIGIRADEQSNSVLLKANPLTRSSGQEWHPSVSPNQKYLTFTEIVANKMRLYVQQLSDGQKLEITPVNDPKAWVGPASWNADGSKIVYLVAPREYCRYYLQTFNEMALGEPTLVHNCPAGSFGKIAFSHQDDTLIYTERAGFDAPYVLFTFDLNTHTKRKLNQPPLVAGGNASFDLHPTDNKILVSSPDEQLWEGFYSVDLATDELQLLFKLDTYICCGIWNHSGDRVVLMGEHPAVQLVSYDLNGQDRQVVYAGSQQLFAPERHPNGKDYLFPAGRNNLDIQFLSFQEGQSTPVVLNSVDDRLVSIHPQSNRLAFVGLASGTEEIWLADTNGQHQRKLTNFNDQRHYLDLRWSPQSDFLAGLTLNEIHLINTRTGASNTLKIPQAQIAAVSFKDEQTLSYSIKVNGQWRVKQYDLNSHTVTSLDPKWQFVDFSPDPQNILWLDQQNQLYAGASAQPLDMSDFKHVNLMSGNRFNLRKLNNHWYWQQWDTQQYQLFKRESNSNTSIPLGMTDSQHFDVSANGVFFHLAERRNTDIFRTVSASQ